MLTVDLSSGACPGYAVVMLGGELDTVDAAAFAGFVACLRPARWG